MRILEKTFEELLEILHREYGKGVYHARGVYRQVFQHGKLRLNNVPEFRNAPSLAGAIESDFECRPGKVCKQKIDGELIKFVTRLTDGHEIESVVIPMATHNTLCVSSQVGCKMGCRFCQTAQLGFARNLTAEEIVGQVFSARFTLGLDIRNIVFMGMGEPLDNFDNVIQAIRVLNDQRGLNIALRYITLSTVGKTKKIQTLASSGLPGLRLAVSLNASNDYIRRQIMPLSEMAPLKDLQKELMEYPLSRKETIFITYVLIQNINDRKEHAAELADFVKPIPSKVNVIPYNPRHQSPFSAPSEKEVQRFCSWLVDCGVFIRRRRTQGQDVMAACGQLGKINHHSGILRSEKPEHLSR